MTTDLRERKKRETRQSLRMAALRLVDAHGLDHVTVEMIADAAGVSPRTVFNYFPTKEDALLGPLADAAADIERFWSERPDGEPPLDSLRALLVHRAEMVSAHSEEMKLRKQVLVANPGLYPRFHASFLALERAVRVAVARRAGLDAEHDLYPAAVAAAGSAAMRVAMDRWRSNSDRQLADIVNEVVDIYATGMTKPSATTRPTQAHAAS